MKKLFILFLVLGFSLCCGCTPRPQVDTPLCRVVTQISITREQADATVSRSYTNSASMSAILSYLRKLSPYSSPGAEPDETAGSRYRIVLEYSDGTQQSYQQIDSTFFQDSSGKWKSIDEETGRDLPLLFKELPIEQSSETEIAAPTGGDFTCNDRSAGILSFHRCPRQK